MFVQAVGILAIATVGGPTAGLDVGNAIRHFPQDTEEGLRMHRARTDLDVVRLLQDAAAVGPNLLQGEDEMLQGGRLGIGTLSAWTVTIYLSVPVLDSRFF